MFQNNKLDSKSRVSQRRKLRQKHRVQNFKFAFRLLEWGLRLFSVIHGFK